MPNKWFPSYTNCSVPSSWYAAPVALSVAIGILGTLGGIAAAIFGGAIGPGMALAAASLCISGLLFIDWWLNIRLICLGGDKSAVGVIYHTEPPTPSLDAFDIGDYDTDYSFNLLLAPFTPLEELPGSFVSNEWDPGAAFQLETTNWPSSFPSNTAQVLNQVNLILPSQSMANLHLSFTGQDVEAHDEPQPQPPDGSSQHFLLHCEIEGAGMEDLKTLLQALLIAAVAAAAVYLIPVVGPILSIILAALAFLAFLIGGPIIQNDDASPPTNKWGGPVVPYSSYDSPDTLIDVVYVYGRWVYDSLHSGWNELHPLHYLIVIEQSSLNNLADGNWPDDIWDLQAKYDQQFGAINDPGTVQIQAQPQNQWKIHPVLDGCEGAVPYPTPPPPGVIQ